MKRLLIVLLCALLCAGCAAAPERAETMPAATEETIPCTETEAAVHEHTFGSWEYGELQMQQECEVCGEIQLRDMTGEESFRHTLQGHWEPYEVTHLGQTQPVYYIRNKVWHYYADYSDGDSLTYTSALGSMDPADFTRELTMVYSHFDAERGTHHAAATSAEGHSFQITLETDHPEPLLRLTPEPGADLFEEIVLSRYQKIAPAAVGTWSGINGGTITYITLNEDLTFTSNIEPFTSGTWQLAPGDGYKEAAGGIQLFYELDGRAVFDIGTFYEEPALYPDVEAEQPGLTLSLYVRNTPTPWALRKLQPEQLQPLMDKGSGMIIGTWDSKSSLFFADNTPVRQIQTGYSLTVNDDGTFTMMAGKKVTGTWTANGSSDSTYNYLFTYPGSGSNGDTVTFHTKSGNLSFSYKAGKTYTHLTFVQYGDEQWADFLAGPGLLPGSYVSQKIVRYDEAGQSTEEAQTGYTLTIKEDGTVTGMLHQAVSGTWAYDDLAPEGGHRYIFRMDHTPPEQASRRTDDGTLVFDTKINKEHVVIYFCPLQPVP